MQNGALKNRTYHWQISLKDLIYKNQEIELVSYNVQCTVYCTVVDGSYPVGEGTNLPKLSDSKNFYYYLFFIQPLIVCSFDHNTEVSSHWSETYQTNQSSWNVLCLIRFPKLAFKFCSTLQHYNDYNLGIDFSNWTDLKEFYQWMDWSGQTVLTNGTFPWFQAVYWVSPGQLRFQAGPRLLLVTWVGNWPWIWLFFWSICWPLFFRFDIPFEILS